MDYNTVRRIEDMIAIQSVAVRDSLGHCDTIVR